MRQALDPRIFKWHYYCTGGTGVAIVAVEGVVKDWAAYILGGSPEYDTNLANECVHHGAKLDETLARRLFDERAQELGLTYRK